MTRTASRKCSSLRWKMFITTLENVHHYAGKCSSLRWKMLIVCVRLTLLLIQVGMYCKCWQKDETKI